jgi:hypothetical protein
MAEIMAGHIVTYEIRCALCGVLLIDGAHKMACGVNGTVQLELRPCRCAIDDLTEKKAQILNRMQRFLDSVTRNL